MSGGYGVGGAGAASTSAAYLSLPYKGYRELAGWFEEFVNAFGSELDILDSRFISATARANLLDPTYAPTEPTDENLATATAAPTAAAIQDSMLDVLAYIALAAYPLNQNFTTAEKQAMVAVGWDAIKRKGTRRALLELAAAACASTLAGWTVPPYNFSLVLADGLPSPGWGSTWSPVSTQQAGTVSTTAASNAVTGAGTAFTTAWHGYRIAVINGATVQTDWVSNVSSATALTTVNNLTANTAGSTFWISPGASFRPWILEALRKIVGRFMVDWSQFGICYSQFRAGYSAAGESVLPSGATLSLVSNPHFDAWSAGAPTGWIKSGAGTLTQSPTVAQINYEFTSSAAQFDLSVAAAGVAVTLMQSPIRINNQIGHRVEVDYAYTNGQLVDTLTLQIQDVTNSQYWNGTAWQTAAIEIALPVSTGAAVRKRYAVTVTPQANSSSTSTLGTASLSVAVSAASDGTASTQVVYTIYRCDVLPLHDVDVEEEAGGERTLWLPLVDQLGHTLSVESGAATIIEPANYDRTAYKLSTGAEFLYHAALSGRGFRARSAWTNQVKGSNDFGADWTLIDATRTANAQISPLIGETIASAVQLTATNLDASIIQTVGAAPINPASDSYVGGVWVKKLSADGVFTDVTLSLVSTSTKSQAYTLTQAQGWTLLPIRHTFGAGDTASLQFQIAWGAASASGAIAVADAYLYEVTNRPGVLYPPVARSGIGATQSTGTRAVRAITASQDANVLDPYLQRSMVQLTRGVAQLTVVPVYDAGSQPNGVIFDFGGGAAANRVVVDISSNTIRARIMDATPTTSTCSLTLTANDDPTSTQATWRRDIAIPIRLRWQDNGEISMSVGASSVSSSTPGSWAPIETAMTKIRVGCDIGDASHFDGIVTLIDVVQVGGPVT